MKKFTIAALAICLAFALATPVMAVDADFTGAYRVRGVFVDKSDMDKGTANDAYMDMRLRLQTVFKVTDILSLTTRIDAFDNSKWGEAANTGSVTKGNDIDLDRVYMTIKAPIGKFDIGRQAGGTFGTLFRDTDTDVDRIKYTKVIDGLTIMAIFEKATEKDSTTSTDNGDQDKDIYHIAPTYKMENITAGALASFTNDKGNDIATTRTYCLTPYFVGKFGPVNIQGEASYLWGTIDYDNAATTDKDYKALAYNLEASFNFGPANIMAGYAFASGEDTDVNDLTASGGVGNDWEKLFILTTNEVSSLINLGGAGNLSKDGIVKATAAIGNDPGAKIIYGGASFSPLDNLKLGVVVGKAYADEVPAGYEDDYGIEYDLTLNWKIYDNLTYSAVAAFLSSGDLWKGGVAGAEVEDVYALFHQLELKF